MVLADFAFRFIYVCDDENSMNMIKTYLRSIDFFFVSTSSKRGHVFHSTFTNVFSYFFTIKRVFNVFFLNFYARQQELL